MDIGNSKLAVGVSLKLFDDLIKGLHQKNVNLKRINFNQEFKILDKISTTIHAIVDINPPELEFEFQDSIQQPIILMHFSGKVKPKITFANKTSDVLFEIPFSATAELQVAVRQPSPAQAPVLGIDYLGVKNVSEPLDDQFVNDLFNDTEYVKIIEDFQLDILEPVIAGLEAIYYADPLNVNPDTLPSHGAYPVLLRHMPAGYKTLDAIGVFFDLPYQSLSVGNVNSFVPSGSELFVQVSEGMLQSMVDKCKTDLQNWFEQNSPTLKVSKLSLSVEDNAVSVYAKVKEKETDSSGKLTGRFHFRHGPGQKKIILDGSELDLDIDLPWWADLLLCILFPIGITVYSAINYVEDAVPDIGQKILGKMINDMFDNLAESINLEGLAVGGVPIEVYPDTIKLDNNALSMKIQVLCQPITETIVWADYSKVLGKFMIFHLASGRQYYVNHLIRFMKLGYINLPGYHILSGKYIRSNPDSETSNNLTELYGR